MRFYRAFLLFGCLLMALLSGCGDLESDRSPASPAQSTTTAAEDSVLDLLRTADTSTVRQAFDARTGTEYFRRSRTRQIDPESKNIIASYETLIRHDPAGGGIERIEADSAGSFSFGVLSSIISAAEAADLLANPAPHLLPQDPAYLSSSGPGQYSYRTLADTSIGGRTVSVVAVAVRPGAGRDQQIRSAHFYIDRSTGKLVGLSVHRRQEALLFSEESRLEVFLQWIDSNGWFPDRLKYRTHLDIPMVRSKYLTTEARYYTELPPGG